MSGVPAEFIRLLKEKNDLAEVIGSYIKLERRGYQYWACCPFHHEKTPSFAINGAEGYYHCFGCSASGDVITFVKNYENVDFMQAVQMLAKRAGLEVPVQDDRARDEAMEKKRKRDRLVSLMRDAARFYFGNFYSGRAQPHVEYAAKRGISPSNLKKFGIGASLDYNGLPSHLLAHGYTQEECLESGACARTEEGKLIDSLGGRLIIPIINYLDEVIAFGGRVMKPTDHAKYKNTRETVLFNKRKNLYNINLVKKEKRAGGLDYLIMVEGYMDAISLYQAGFKNVVASMGTSLTKEQAQLAKRYSDAVYISYDGDAAGQAANLRGLKLLEDEGISLRVVPLGDGMDPDDIVRKLGAAEYRKRLDMAMPLIDFRVLCVQRKYDLTKTFEKREFVKEVLPVVKEAESETEREQLLARVSSLSGISVGALLRDLEKEPEEKKPSPRPERPKAERDDDPERRASRFVLAACLLSKPYALAFDPSALGWSDEEHRKIAEFIAEGRKSGHFRPSGVFDVVPPDGEIAEILNLDAGEALDGEKAERYFHDCLAVLEKIRVRTELARLKEQYDSAEPDDKRAILFRIGELTKKLKSGGNI